MALETLKNVTEINGVKVLQERIKAANGVIDWEATDEARKHSPIFVDHDVNMISFRIQNGPIKEAGKNGCQVTDIIAVAKHIIEGLDGKFPCPDNEATIYALEAAIRFQNQRTLNRERRGVEGRSKA